MPDARAELRLRLIDQLRGFTCAHDEIVGCPPCVADRVMSGAEVRVELVRLGADGHTYLPVDPVRLATHTRFVLTTAPQPIRETEDA